MKRTSLPLQRRNFITAILKQRTSTVPIVFVNVADPVATGFVTSFAHPAGSGA